MAAPRKVFRIEKIAAPRFEPQSDESHAPRHGEIMQELSALRAMLAAAPAAAIAQGSASRQDEIQRLVSELRLIQAAFGQTDKRSPQAADRQRHRPRASPAS
jgi:hypothetical protein